MFESVTFNVELAFKKIRVYIYWSLDIYLDMILSSDINYS